jgi:hypothetical protein
MAIHLCDVGFGSAATFDGKLAALMAARHPWRALGATTASSISGKSAAMLWPAKDAEPVLRGVATTRIDKGAG